MPLPLSHYSIVWAWTTVPLFISERWNNVTPKSFTTSWVCAQYEIMSFWFMQINHPHFMVSHLCLFSVQILVPKTKKQKWLIWIGGEMQYWSSSSYDFWNVYVWGLDTSREQCYILSFCLLCLVGDEVPIYISACVSAFVQTVWWSYTRTYTKTNRCLDRKKKNQKKKKSWSRNICNKFIMYFYIIFCTWKITLNDIFR